MHRAWKEALPAPLTMEVFCFSLQLVCCLAACRLGVCNCKGTRTIVDTLRPQKPTLPNCCGRARAAAHPSLRSRHQLQHDAPAGTMLVRCKLVAAAAECTVAACVMQTTSAKQPLTAFTADSSLSAADVGFFFLITTESQSCPLRFMLMDCCEGKRKSLRGAWAAKQRC
jgi:hypothetical protein